jgi:hypothetical protein
MLSAGIYDPRQALQALSRASVLSDSDIRVLRCPACGMAQQPQAAFFFSAERPYLREPAVRPAHHS